MKKFMFIFAIVGLILTASCTPEAISSDEQQIDKEDYNTGADG